MHEIEVDMSPEHLEAVKAAKELFEPIKEKTFNTLMNRHQRRAAVAEERHADRPVHTVLTMAGSKKIGRNQSCPCNSGRKYKKCCGIGA